jgi:hypothetical protein
MEEGSAVLTIGSENASVYSIAMAFVVFVNVRTRT